MQDAYIGFVKKVVEKLKNHPEVIGYDIMNEPLSGYIGCKDLNKHIGIFQLGETPTPFEGMVLGAGNSAHVDVWKQKKLVIRKDKKIELNQKKNKAWQTGFSCVWKEHGVWGISEKGESVLLKPDYFKNFNFEDEFYKPFINKVGKEILAISPNTILLVEHVVGSPPPKWSEKDVTNVVFTSHWYDAVLLATKQFFRFFGFDMVHMKKIVKTPKNLRKAFADQIWHLKAFAKEHMGNIPLIITEFGIPQDLASKKAYKSGDFSLQDKALHRTFLAIEDNLASSILWNYTGHNSNAKGDHWNEEDLSIYSKDQHTSNDPSYSGARAKNAFIRPYPIKTAGKPLYLQFKMTQKIFEYHFEHDDLIDHPTEIFLPHLHFGKGFTIELSDGSYELDESNQIIYYNHTKDFNKHSIIIKAKYSRSKSI